VVGEWGEGERRSSVAIHPFWCTRASNDFEFLLNVKIFLGAAICVMLTVIVSKSHVLPRCMSVNVLLEKTCQCYALKVIPLDTFLA
jgi:hypothetical protein